MPNKNDTLDEDAWTCWRKSPKYKKILQALQPIEGEFMIYINRPTEEIINGLKYHGFKCFEIGNMAAIKIKTQDKLNYFKLMFDHQCEYAISNQDSFGLLYDV